MAEITIRREKSIDPAAIRRVLDGTFGRGDEASAVEAMRLRGVLALSLVALKAENIVAHLGFSAAQIDAGATPRWLDGPMPSAADRAAAAAPRVRPAPETSTVERAPDPSWLSLEEEFEKEEAAREMAEVAEAAARAAEAAKRAARRRPAASIDSRLGPVAPGAPAAPAFVVLAPLAVLPHFQNRRIGIRLVEAGLDLLGKLECKAVFVLGDPDFFGRFGFESTRPRDISCELNVKSAFFQVKELVPNALEGVRGVVRFEPELRSLG